MKARAAGQQRGTATAKAVASQFFTHARHDTRVRGKSQIIVAGEIDELAAVDRDLNLLRTITFIQVARAVRESRSLQTVRDASSEEVSHGLHPRTQA